MSFDQGTYYRAWDLVLAASVRLWRRQQSQLHQMVATSVNMATSNVASPTPRVHWSRRSRLARFSASHASAANCFSCVAQ